MKVTAITYIFLLILPALSIPRVVPKSKAYDDSEDEHVLLLSDKDAYPEGDAVNDTPHEDLPHSKAPKSEEPETETATTTKTSSDKSTTTTIIPDMATTTSATSTTSTTSTTSESIAKGDWITMPLKPGINPMFYVPTLLAPQSTPSTTTTTVVVAGVAADAQETSTDTSVPGDSDQRRRRAPLTPASINPRNVPPTPLPTSTALAVSAAPRSGQIN